MTALSAPRRVLVATLGVGVLLSASACSGSTKKTTSTTPTSSASSVAPKTTTPSPKPAPLNPYTGVGAVPSTPTISVKIDDTEAGRPQLGIDKADIVYIEAVEGGLTRLAAIFGTHKPVVGYVRSTRPSDPDLLLQFGTITAAYSGGAHDSLPLIAASGLTRWSDDAGAAYYSRQPHDGDRGYVNLTLNLAQVAKHTKQVRPTSIGWTFSAGLTGLSTAPATDIRTVVRGSYASSAGTPVEFRWDPKLQRYVRYIDGARQVAADGNPVTATNVIVQFCKVVSHPQDTDIDGNPAQFTYTIGTGKVAVFRQGRQIVGTWSRAGVHDGTTLRTSTGAVLPLDPGNTWVVLATTGTPLTT